MASAPRVRFREVGVYLRRVRTRLPFRYGKANVTGQPYAHVRAAVEVEGRRVTGVSAAALPPLWFDKDPSRTHEDDVRDLLLSLRLAAEVYAAGPAGDAFRLHRAGEPEARGRCAARGLNDLTSGFGVALLDAAAVDAVCRATGQTFHRGLRDDLFGFGRCDVPASPLRQVAVRHTVGLADPLRADDPRAPIADGLPETLEDAVRAYGLRYFKVKVSGDAGESTDRLRRIAEVLDRESGDYAVTLDGNEQFHGMDEAADFLRRAAADPALGNLWRRTLWVEQPVERSAALSPGVAAGLRAIPRPVIIDESDGTDEAVDEALALGYRGISAKNCKGVFRTLHSHRRARERGAELSSEDLMNIPVVPLQQDLCVAAALGIPHSERNGHHYIRAFLYLSPKEREDALREFPSLYRPAASGPPAVRIEGGGVDLAEVNAVGFGVASEPDWASLEPASLPP